MAETDKRAYAEYGAACHRVKGRTMAVHLSWPRCMRRIEVVCRGAVVAIPC